MLVSAILESDEVVYEKFCLGEITFEQLQNVYSEMRQFAEQAERLITRIA